MNYSHTVTTIVFYELFVYENAFGSHKIINSVHNSINHSLCSAVICNHLHLFVRIWVRICWWWVEWLVPFFCCWFCCKMCVKMAMFVSEADSHGKNAIYYNIRSFCCTIERLPVWDLGLFSNNNKKCKKKKLWLNFSWKRSSRR